MNIPSLAAWFSLQMNWPSVCAPLAWEVGLQEPLHQRASRLCYINKINLINLQINSLPFPHTGLFLPFAEPKAKVQMEDSSLCLTPAFLPIDGSNLHTGGYVSMHKDTSIVYPVPAYPIDTPWPFFRPRCVYMKMAVLEKTYPRKSPIRTCWQRWLGCKGLTFRQMHSLALWLLTV